MQYYFNSINPADRAAAKEAAKLGYQPIDVATDHSFCDVPGCVQGTIPEGVPCRAYPFARVLDVNGNEKARAEECFDKAKLEEIKKAKDKP